ncbi:MAG: efflux RND transporter permease subunit [Chromatiales bacterium]|nr:efflux RND transporter permease subunit [Chromatiales bacterium]
MTQKKHPPASAAPAEPPRDLGIAGTTARAFIHSPLAPLLYLAMLGLGILGLMITPRQEDPEISVPVVDLLLDYPGASAEQVASLAIEPLERMMSEITRVKHVYSASRRGGGVVTVEFDVGEEIGPSLVKVNAKIDSNLDKLPPGVQPPLVVAKGIDDVPVVTLTLWSETADDGVLRSLAQELLQILKQIPDTGTGFVTGGRAEQIRVEILPERLSGYDITPDQVAAVIRSANSEQRAGDLERDDEAITVYSGAFLRTADDLSGLIVGTREGAPVYLRDVANVFDGLGEPRQFVSFSSGPAWTGPQPVTGAPAVTIALAKKQGANGVTVVSAVLDQVEALRERFIPNDVHVEVTRNYGQTAQEKVNGLIFKLFIVTIAVTILVWFALGLRPAIVVGLVIPVVILITIFAAWAQGYSINRVSLFALIFAIGILVDDAIVVVENMYRRWLMAGATDTNTALDSVREVGNPTIVATFTVIAALLPMGFVTGMMGPYMQPIPALASVAMIASVIAAFVFTPWLAMRVRPSMEALNKAGEKEHKSEQRIDRLFRRLLVPMIENRALGWAVLIGIIAAFVLSIALFAVKFVPVKMLPFDNKDEFAIVIDLPEGSALVRTATLAEALGRKLHAIPEVLAYQTYVGTARPFDFNGMVRHYYLRSDPWQAAIQIQLQHKSTRQRSSHAIASQARDLLTPLAREHGARVTIAEIPPGPPVLQSVVAEVYGDDNDARRQVARDITAMFEQVEAEGMLGDVDNYLSAPHRLAHFEVDTEKANRRGVTVETLNRNLGYALGGTKLGDAKRGNSKEPVDIIMEVPLAERADLLRLVDLPIPAAGGSVPLGELGRFVEIEQDPPLLHKDLRAVEYVVADAVGRLGAPIYPMTRLDELLADYQPAEGSGLEAHYTGAPRDVLDLGVTWAGEWTVTYETFRDLGIAFAAALLLIYVLVVGQFGNFVLPVIIMAPIPLTLIGIVPGHWFMGAEFTATSMIGFIALAGIIVRNSILLVDFATEQVRGGMDVREAVLASCRARTRPIIITAAALIVDSLFILNDPIFQGMAISLLFGVLVSTLLTLVVIPLGCLSAAQNVRACAQRGVQPAETAS